jgi:hypothetical protein
MSTLYRGPSINASYQVSVHLAIRFQRKRFFRHRPIRNKNCMWPLNLVGSIYVWKVLCKDCSFPPDPLTDMVITGNSCFWLVDFLKFSFSSFGNSVSEEKIFRNQPIRNKNCLWWLFLLTNKDEMSTLYRGPSINASYQVSVYLAIRFQRKRFFRHRPIRNKNCRSSINIAHFDPIR